MFHTPPRQLLDILNQVKAGEGPQMPCRSGLLDADRVVVLSWLFRLARGCPPPSPPTPGPRPFGPPGRARLAPS